MRVFNNNGEYPNEVRDTDFFSFFQNSISHSPYFPPSYNADNQLSNQPIKSAEKLENFYTNSNLSHNFYTSQQPIKTSLFSSHHLKTADHHQNTQDFQNHNAIFKDNYYPYQSPLPNLRIDHFFPDKTSNAANNYFYNYNNEEESLDKKDGDTRNKLLELMISIGKNTKYNLQKLEVPLIDGSKDEMTQETMMNAAFYKDGDLKNDSNEDKRREENFNISQKKIQKTGNEEYTYVINEKIDSFDNHSSNERLSKPTIFNNFVPLMAGTFEQ